MIRWILPLLLLLLSGCDRRELPALETAARLEVQPGEQRITVGDPAEFTLTLWSREPAAIPDLEELIAPPLRLLGQHSDEAIQHGPQLWELPCTFRVTCFRTNEAYEVFNTNRVSIQLTSPIDVDLPFARLDMTRVLSNETAEVLIPAFEAPDLRGPVAKARFWRQLTAALIACAAVLAALAIVLHLRRKAGQQPPPAPRWDVIALKKFEALKRSRSWNEEDLDAVAVALSRILREYIEGRFAIHAPESTTEEFLDLTRDQFPWTQEQQDMLEGFLERTDAIKFAGDRPAMQLLADLCMAAEAFVHATPEPEPSSGEDSL